MIKDYQIVSPSLGGILSHESIVYEGLKRPPEIAEIFDRPALQASVDQSLEPDTAERRKMIEEYFHDLYGILMKRISQFAIESEPSADESVRLIAMLQEFVKVKGLMAGGVEHGELLTRHR